MTGATSRRRLGRILVEKGVISEFQLHHALAFQRLDGRPLGEILLELGLVSRAALAQALGEHFGSEPESLRTPADGSDHGRLEGGEAALEARSRELDEREASLAAGERAHAAELELRLERIEERERGLLEREDRLARKERELAAYVAQAQEQLRRLELKRLESTSQTSVAEVVQEQGSDPAAAVSPPSGPRLRGLRGRMSTRPAAG